MVMVDIHCSYFYKKKKQAQYKISITVLKETGTPQQQQGQRLHGGTQARLDLERGPLIRITEQCSKENSKLQPIATVWGTPLLTEQMGKVFISDSSYLPLPYLQMWKIQVDLYKLHCS